MPKAFDLSTATRVAVQRAGKTAKLAFVKNDTAIKEWKVGEALDLSEELVAYHEECRTTINQMVALNGGLPSNKRTRINAAQSALLKQLRELHGEDFDFVGGYYSNPIEFDDDGNATKFEAVWVAQRTA